MTIGPGPRNMDDLEQMGWEMLMRQEKEQRDATRGRNELLTALRDANEGWLPGVGKVFTVTLDPAERDILTSALSETPRTSPAALTMLALDRMIDSVAQDISEEDPGNHATIGMLRGEDKGLRSARTYLAAAIENAAPQGRAEEGSLPTRNVGVGEQPAVAAPASVPSAIARSDLYPAMAKPIVHGQREQEDYRRALEAIIADPEADAVAIAHAAITPYTPWVAVDE